MILQKVFTSTGQEDQQGQSDSCGQCTDIGIEWQFVFFILTIKGVLRTLAAAEGGQSLADLKIEHPLLVSEVAKGKYTLIDGNHRLAVQWDDVS